MSYIFNKRVKEFVSAASEHGVKMLMVGGGAVNFHGYQRHSADVDFWIDISEENLKNLIKALRSMGYQLEDFNENIKQGQQNISIKISPVAEIELITNFNPNKTFEEAYKDKFEVKFEENPILKYDIISLDDLITSKIKSGRNKDLLDVYELKRINNLK